MLNKAKDLDDGRGSLVRQILIFSLPIMAMNLLQLLFNAADMIVVGRFAGKESLAAVGATGSIINLIVNLFMGLAVGTSVVVAQDYGADKWDDVSKSVHTSLTISLVSGIFVMIIGLIFCRPLLRALGTPKDIIDLSATYMTIYFIGVPASMVYNFGAAILRAVGDSRRPMYYLTISGTVNVLLNLLFVVAFKWNVAGVAWSTVISQYLAMVLILICLYRSHGAIAFVPKETKIHKDKLVGIIKIGLPAGLQSLLFSVSNVLIQSAINSFGSSLVAANSASGNLISFVDTTTNAFYNSAVTFTGQSIGAKEYDRIDSIAKVTTGLLVVSWIILGGLMFFLGEHLLKFYTTDPEVIELGILRLNLVMITYLSAGIMNIYPGFTRAMGYSILPMIMTLIGACILRIVWLYTFFAWYPTVIMLYLSYPITWTISGIGQVGSFFYARNRVRKEAIERGDLKPKKIKLA